MSKNILEKAYISVCTQKNIVPNYENALERDKLLISSGVIPDGTAISNRESAVELAILTGVCDYLGKSYETKLSMLYHIYSTRGYDYPVGRSVFMDFAREMLFEAMDDTEYSKYAPEKMILLHKNQVTESDMWDIIFELSAFAMYRYLMHSKNLKKVLFKERGREIHFEWQGLEYSVSKPLYSGHVYEMCMLPYTSLFICKRGYTLLVLDIGRQKTLGGEFECLGSM